MRAFLSAFGTKENHYGTVTW